MTDSSLWRSVPAKIVALSKLVIRKSRYFHCSRASVTQIDEYIYINSLDDLVLEQSEKASTAVAPGGLAERHR